MKQRHWMLVAVVACLYAAFVIPTFAGKGETEKNVTLDQVPAAVKATILKQAGDNKIEEIEEVSVNGKVVCYEAEWKTDGKEIEIKVAPCGKLLKKEIEDDDDDDDDDDD